MPIISVRDNENSRYARNAKKPQTTTTTKQRQRGARGTEAIVKGWELNDFVVHLS